jgi:CheY-like chemotaxis protein
VQQNATHGRRRGPGTPNRTDERPLARLRVLVVDDEPLIGTTLRILLDDHEVAVASSGLAARELLERGESYDVVLCDLMLADFSGMDLARWIASARPELTDRLVLMTGGAFTDDARAFLRGVPATRQLEKPFSTDQIMRILRSL